MADECARKNFVSIWTCPNPKCKKEFMFFCVPEDITCSCKFTIKKENSVNYDLSETEYDKMKLKEFKANEKIRIAKEKEKSKKKLNKAKK